MKIGIKLWSTNKGWFDEANQLYKEKKIDYVELYTIPGSYETFDFNRLKMPIIIHAPHSEHGFNIADKRLKESNITKIKETIKFADRLKAKYIIVHPGFNGTSDAVKEFLKEINDKRVLIENVPKKGIDGSLCVGYDTKTIKEFMDLGFGLCLDFVHAIKSAISQKRDYKGVIRDYLRLNPKMFHICNGGLFEEADEHLNLWEGELDMAFLKKCVEKSNSPIVTLEVPKEGNSLANDVKNIEYFKKLNLSNQ